MYFAQLSYWPIVAAGIASTVLGIIWYSPILFGKAYMKEMGTTDAEAEEFRKNMTWVDTLKMFGSPLVLSLISAFVIGALLNSLVVVSFTGYLVFAVLIWLGFSMPVSMNMVIFGKSSVRLFLINVGYQLVSIVAATIVIGIWG